MDHEQIGPSSVSAKGARPSIIESFGIDGLYGYRSISLASDHAATILIAKNGTGKTTLIGALDAFLRLQFNRLRNLEFREIRCRLRGVEEELILSNEDLRYFYDPSTIPELIKISKQGSVEPEKMFSFILEKWSPDFQQKNPDYMDFPAFADVYRSLAFSSKATREAFASVRDAIYNTNPRIKYISETIRKAIGEYEIVYLPTYRRVELALTDEGVQGRSRRYRRPKFNVAAGSLYTGDIQFGLSDISDRLGELNQRIILDSNNGYREISAKIINELVDGSFEKELESRSEIPGEDELKLLFSRLEQSKKIGGFASVRAPDIQAIYSDQVVPESSSKFLNYFLRKLSTVVNASKDVETLVDGFVDKCNKYLSSFEPSTQIYLEGKGGVPIDAKILELDKKDLSVEVRSLPHRRKIPLDFLSSGEKQMISLFAKLYLYPSPKIVLIDEPELSLSIDWQMDILVDVLDSPLCEQIIAITHSPFVFDNDLEPFARSLRTSVEMDLGAGADDEHVED